MHKLESVPGILVVLIEFFQHRVDLPFIGLVEYLSDHLRLERKLGAENQTLNDGTQC